MKFFIMILSWQFLVSCHYSDVNKNMGPKDNGRHSHGDNTIKGNADIEDTFTVSMVTEPGTVEKTIETFKIELLNGYCDVNPIGLTSRKSRMSFDGAKVTFEIQKGNCVEIVERSGRWVHNNIQATLLVTGGFLKSSCPDSEPAQDVYQIYNFDIDESLKYVALYSTNARGCWWAKRIE